MATGVLLPAPVFVAVDADGAPIAGALLQFYVTGTTTPTAAYADAGLTTPLTNPVAADGSGLFAAIYLDPTVTYRIQLQTAGGSVIADIDPANLDTPAATQTQVNTGTATGVYVSPATLAAWTGVATALGYTPLNKAGDTATNLVIAPTAPVASSAGYLGAPVNTQNGDYTLVLGDAGKTLHSTAASAVTWTLPVSTSAAYPVGTVIAFANMGAGTVTITSTSGVTVTLAGTGDTGDRSLAQYGLATATMLATDSWLIGGTGLS
jgi:hypothetical protein